MIEAHRTVTNIHRSIIIGVVGPGEIKQLGHSGVVYLHMEKQCDWTRGIKWSEHTGE
jgi:hypothetical protein